MAYVVSNIDVTFDALRPTGKSNVKERSNVGKASIWSRKTFLRIKRGLVDAPTM